MLQFIRLWSPRSAQIFLPRQPSRAYVKLPPCGRLIHCPCAPIPGAHGKGRLAMPYSKMTGETCLGITGLHRKPELEKRPHTFLLNDGTERKPFPMSVDITWHENYCGGNYISWIYSENLRWKTCASCTTPISQFPSLNAKWSPSTRSSLII